MRKLQYVQNHIPIFRPWRVSERISLPFRLGAEIVFALPFEMLAGFVVWRRIGLACGYALAFTQNRLH